MRTNAWRCARRIPPLLLLLASLSWAPAARAQDRFEIQVYDAETARPGHVGFELHLNDFVVGTTSPSADGELPTNHMAHLTLEPHVGIASWCEAGGYVQTAIRGDGTFDFAGLKLRLKARIPRRVKGVLGFALNFEISSIPQEYEAPRFGVELRPIVDLSWKRLYVAVNPIVDIALAGRTEGHPELQPAIKAMVRATNYVALGAEYYSAFGPLDAIAPRSQQQNLLLGVLDWNVLVRGIDIGVDVGAGYDFTGPDRVIVKTIVGMELPR